MDASEIYSKRLSAKEVIFPKETEKFIFQPQMDESNFLEEIRNWEHPPWYSWRIRRVSPTTSRFTSGCRWCDKLLFVHVRTHHIPPSRWTQSQTLLAERRTIPYSTEIHWRLQNYLYEFWMLCKNAASMTIGISMDQERTGFTQFTLLEETSRRTNVVQEETDKTAVNIQARSFTARALDKIGKKY